MPWKSWLVMVLGIAAGGWALAEYVADRGGGGAEFVVPSKQIRDGAVGSPRGLDPAMRKAFADHGEFEANVI